MSIDNYILAINPGSTSTKIALYKNDLETHKTNIEHSSSDLEQYSSIASEYPMRYQAIRGFLDEIGFDDSKLSAVVGRGGLLPPVESGAYRVNESMVNRLKNNPVVEHASNLGGIIAYEIAKPLGIGAYIYDSVAVDELDDIARISGMKDIKRKSFSHALNMRAVAFKVAGELGKKYNELNLIVTHLGGGHSVSIHKQGRMIDIVSDDEGPFSPERSGRVPCKDLVAMCFQEGASKDEMKKKVRGKGGIISYLNTNNAIEVEAMINSGNEEAKMIYEAMAYQISKGIGELATVVNGQVDGIIITGGIAYSKMITEWIKDRVSFIAPVHIVPGENELQSLASGVLRVIKGEEAAHEYTLG